MPTHRDLEPAASARPTSAHWGTSVPPWIVVALAGALVLTVSGLAVSGSDDPARILLVFVALPVAILTSLVLSHGRHARLLVAAMLLIDVETLVVAWTWAIGLTYAVLLPLIGLVLVLRVLEGRALRLAFIASGATGFVAVVVALVAGPAAPTVAGMSQVVAVSASGALIAFACAYLYRLHDQLTSAVARAASEIAARAEAEGARARLATAVEHAADVVFVTDEQRVIRYANPAFAKVTGYPVAEAIGRTIKELVRSGLHDAGFYADLREATASGLGWSGTIVNRRRDGSTFDFEVSMAPIRDADARVVGSVTVGRDRTEDRRLAREATFRAELRGSLLAVLHDLPDGATSEQAAAAICDALVGLPLVDFAAVFAFEGPEGIRSLAHRAPAGFPLAPVVGSAERARAIRARVEHGTFAEYWTMAPGDATWGAALGAMGFVAAAFAPIVHGDHVDGVVAIGTSDRAFAETLVERLPAAVDLSTTPSALLAERLHQRRIDVETRSVLEGIIRDGAFQPVFQPIVDLASSCVAGYEALTRFDAGLAPDVAFADAWRVGLGQALELATLRRALVGARALPSGRWLGVNVSPSLLADRDALVVALAEADRPLVLEITEHQVVGDYGAIRELVADLGPDVRLAVDDAGAGVANFGHIVELGPDLVKLDRSLVREVNSNLGRQALVIAMSHFAKTAGCRLIAEGIETPAELATLVELGVEFGQGYLLGRPASPLQLAKRRSCGPATTHRAGAGRCARAG